MESQHFDSRRTIVPYRCVQTLYSARGQTGQGSGHKLNGFGSSGDMPTYLEKGPDMGCTAPAPFRGVSSYLLHLP